MSEHTPITIPMTVSADDTTFEMSVRETEVSRTVPVSSQVAYTGPRGPQGEQGPAGYTPVRGTDYWTAADQQTVIDAAVAAVLDAYPAAESEAF